MIHLTIDTCFFLPIILRLAVFFLFLPDQLSLDNLGDVLEELYEVNIKWYNMGLRLGLQSSCLDRIRVASTHDPADCFREMLKEWFKHCRQECSWLALVLALRSSAVGESSLARRMEKKYCNGSKQLNKDLAKHPKNVKIPSTDYIVLLPIFISLTS